MEKKHMIETMGNPPRCQKTPQKLHPKTHRAMAPDSLPVLLGDSRRASWRPPSRASGAGSTTTTSSGHQADSELGKSHWLRTGHLYNTPYMIIYTYIYIIIYIYSHI